MGLRLRAGPSGHDVRLAPDPRDHGQAIGSGLPVAAVLGTTAAFAAVEDGRAGTYHGNPLVTVAVLATFRTLVDSDDAAFLARGNRLRAATAGPSATRALRHPPPVLEASSGLRAATSAL